MHRRAKRAGGMILNPVDTGEQVPRALSASLLELVSGQATSAAGL